MNTIKCLIVDDEELARTLLKTYISRLDFLELVGAAENVTEAINILHDSKIDLIFLDIQMPDVKGTDFAKMISSTSKIIFTTAYSEYALDGFELNALDYLLKPIAFERFLVAVNKAQHSIEVQNPDFDITVKSGYDLYKLKVADILYIEGSSEYVTFYTADKKIMSYQTLKSLEELLPRHSFMRVHRSYIVNKKRVTALKGKDLIVATTKIPVSATYFEIVKQQLF
ncbi:response regulator transcription factor [Aquimarina sp. U1-2]|uniref:LytR/AlgR family response regulator transcription factor n=1 Tax=Aquimarina sp. U1-2 TaxID=2823141 RepID=UPI001AEC918F|nr:LytTR family DNA-binding domain-containing protein [Aquimarina sp. U1-2]MBP2830667.1 response regulator transcription factor [Aquimarina sp. U1-2]